MWPNAVRNLAQDLKLAARNLFRHRRRSFFALATVGGGVVAFLLAGGFIQWIFVNMRESTIHSQLGHIQLVRPGFLSGGQADPYSYLIDKTPIDTASAPETQIIKTLAPRLTFGGLLSKGDATVSFIGEGIEPDLEAPISKAITMVQGKSLVNGPDNGVLLGEGLALSIGATPGDTVVLLGTTAAGNINAVECVVTGVFATITKAYDDVALRAPIGMARRLMRVGGSTSWVILLNDTANTEATVRHLRATMPPGEFDVVPWSDQADFYNKTVELFSRQVGVVRLMIGLIVVLTISNTLMMSVLERTSEIGTAMAIGVKRRGILQQFVSEGLMIGLIGGIGGIAMGLLLGQLISMIGIPMPPPPGMAHGFTGQITITLSLAVDALGLALITSFLASLVPAWKASRMIVVDALRHQR